MSLLLALLGAWFVGGTALALLVGAAIARGERLPRRSWPAAPVERPLLSSWASVRTSEARATLLGGLTYPSRG